MKTKRRNLFLFTVSVTYAIMLTALAAHAYDTVVTGKHNEHHDAQAVQEAVDNGGAVLLKGTFNFGQKGQVTITKDVAVEGELDSSARPATKIIGGFCPFQTTLPATDLPLPGPGPKIMIKNIHFEGATWTPMHFPYTSGAEISGNTITNVKPYGIPRKWKGGDSLLVSAGALLGTRFAHSEKILPGAVTGRLTFTNNKVDLKQ